MKVRTEEQEGCRRVVHVEIPHEAVKPEYEGIVREFAKVAKVSGFRKGKAPADVVERRFAQQIEEEAKERLVPRFYRDAIQSENISPVSVVDVADVVLDKSKGLTFKATVDVAPHFKLPRYRKIALKGNPVKVTDDDVEKAVQGLRERLARFEDVSGRNVARGDLVRIDYGGTCDGRPVAELAPEQPGLGEGKDFWALVGDPEFLPGFAAGMEGAGSEESREIKIAFPADYHVKAVAGKEAVYTMTVKGVREKVLPAFDAELFKQVEVESEQALRDKAREELEQNAGETEKERLKEEIARYLLEKTNFDLPQSLVDREKGEAARSIVQRMAMQGGTREQIEARKDDILSSAEQSSVSRVKLSYILERIANEEKIEVEDGEVDKRIEEMAASRGWTAERLRSEMEKRGGTEWVGDEIRGQKTLDALLGMAKIKNRER